MQPPPPPRPLRWTAVGARARLCLRCLRGLEGGGGRLGAVGTGTPTHGRPVARHVPAACSTARTAARAWARLVAAHAGAHGLAIHDVCVAGENVLRVLARIQLQGVAGGRRAQQSRGRAARGPQTSKPCAAAAAAADGGHSQAPTPPAASQAHQVFVVALRGPKIDAFDLLQEGTLGGRVNRQHGGGAGQPADPTHTGPSPVWRPFRPAHLPHPMAPTLTIQSLTQSKWKLRGPHCEHEAAAGAGGRAAGSMRPTLRSCGSRRARGGMRAIYRAVQHPAATHTNGAPSMMGSSVLTGSWQKGQSGGASPPPPLSFPWYDLAYTMWWWVLTGLLLGRVPGAAPEMEGLAAQRAWHGARGRAASAAARHYPAAAAAAED